MDDDERAALAKRSLELIRKAEKLNASSIQKSAQDAVENAARDAVLGVVRRVAGPGAPPPPPRPGPTNEELDETLADMEAESTRNFDRALAKAAVQAQENDAVERAELEAIRRSFPPASRELAALVFGAMDLLHDVVERDHPPTEEHLRKREELLGRIEALLRPRAGAALESFVAHVIAASAERRRRG
jgi:hypothetical protein